MSTPGVLGATNNLRNGHTRWKSRASWAWVGAGGSVATETSELGQASLERSPVPHA